MQLTLQIECRGGLGERNEVNINLWPPTLIVLFHRYLLSFKSQINAEH